MTPALNEFQFSYISKELILLLLNGPSEKAIKEMRVALDLIEDSLKYKTLEK